MGRGGGLRAVVVLGLLGAMVTGLAGQVANPVFAPGDGSPLPAQVSLTCATADAVIRYTRDGLPPGPGSSLYTAPLDLDRFTVIRAQAYKDGFEPSEVVSAGYYPPQPDHGFTSRHAATNESSAVARVVMEVGFATPPACFAVEEHIPFPLVPSSVDEGGAWIAEERVIRWGPFRDRSGVVLSYQVSGGAGTFALRGTVSVDGARRFEPLDLHVTLADDSSGNPVVTIPDRVAQPILSPAWGTNLPIEVSITCDTTNAVIHYTLDGSVPGPGSSAYAGPIRLEQPGVVRARGFREGWEPSVVVSSFYGVALPAPDLAVAYLVESNAPAVARVTMSLTPQPGQQCATVEALLPRGLQLSGISAAGVLAADGSTIRWGPFVGESIPTLSFEASGPSGLGRVTTRWSVDGRTGWDLVGTNWVWGAGDESTVPEPPVAVITPVLTPSASSDLPVQVAIACAELGAEIRYTLDGTVPSASSSLYGDPLPVTNPAVIRARAFKAGLVPSDTVSGEYRQAIVPATANMERSITGNGTFRPLVTVSVSPGPGVESYTVTETLPDGLTPSDVGQGGEWNPGSRTVRWGPFAGGARSLTYGVSGPTADYELTGTGSCDGYLVAISGQSLAVVDLSTMPSISPVVIEPVPGGIFPVLVTLTTATEGAVIHYTIDGSAPSAASPVYTGPFRLETVAWVKAVAMKDWMAPVPSTDLLFGVESLPGADGAMLRRTVTGMGNDLRQVTLDARPIAVVGCYTVEEVLPAGLTPTRLASGGVYHATSRTIRWGPFVDHQPRRLHYTLTGPDGVYELAGFGSFNGFTFDTSGDRTAILNDRPFIVHGLISEGAGDPALFEVRAQPPVGALCYTVEEFLPSGMVPSRISHEGVWSSGGHAIKWGPFQDDVGRAFRFELDPAAIGALFRCRISVDGSSREIVQELRPPNILDYRTNLTLSVSPQNCQATIPDVTRDVRAEDNATGADALVIWQDPPEGTAVGPGLVRLEAFVMDASENITVCTTLVSVVDQSLPVLTLQPTNVTVLPRESARFEVAAQSCSPVNFSWYLNGATLLEGTGPVLTITNVSYGHEGLYSVVLANGFGAVTSAPARLTVMDVVPPVIQCPGSMRFYSGTPEGLRVDYAIVATDDRGFVEVASVPPSGSAFPVGTTVVRAIATDPSGNSSACTFEVTVLLRQTADRWVNQDIPDNSVTGLTSELFLDSAIANIARVTVSLTITNGWNGDLFASLTHGSGRAVLLNRVGRTAGSEFGYSDSGFADVTLADDAPMGDIHVYRVVVGGDPWPPRGGPLTGAWAPDGRVSDPALVTEVDERSALLATFHGLPASGRWRLFLQDVGPKDTSTLVRWSLVVEGTLEALPPPEFNRLGEVSFGPSGVGMTYQGLAGRSYVFQRSTDLTDWVDVQTQIAPPSGVVHFNDPHPPPGQAYYRTRSP